MQHIAYAIAIVLATGLVIAGVTYGFIAAIERLGAIVERSSIEAHERVTAALAAAVTQTITALGAEMRGGPDPMPSTTPDRNAGADPDAEDGYGDIGLGFYGDDPTDGYILEDDEADINRVAAIRPGENPFPWMVPGSAAKAVEDGAVGDGLPFGARVLAGEEWDG